MVIFYNQKPFVRRRLRRCRLRHKIRAIKTRPNNPLRFLQRKNSIRRYLANDLTCAARKTKFRTRKRFHNNQYTPKSKDQPFNKKQPIGTINQIKQSEKTISSINRKINHTNNHDKQSTQSLKKHAQNKHDIQSNNTPRIFEY